MNKKSLLTKREKVLLIFLAVFVSTGIYVFLLLLPAIRTRDTLQAELDNANITLMQLNSQSISVNTLQANITQMRDQIAEYYAKFNGLSPTEQLESVFTKEMIKDHIKPESVWMTIFDPNAETVEGEPDKTPPIGTVRYTVEVKGIKSNLNDLLSMPEFMNGIYSYRLTGMQTGSEDSFTNLQTSDELTAQYTIDVVLTIPALNTNTDGQ